MVGKVAHATKNFILRYSFKPEFFPNPNIISNPFHPLYKATREKFAAKTPQLVVNVTATKKAIHGKATIRNRAVRRVRTATYDLLRERGYKQDGRVKDQTLKKNGKRDLIGTLAFWPTKGAILEEWLALKKEVEEGLEKFLRAHEITRAKEDEKGVKTGGQAEVPLTYHWAREVNSQGRSLGREDKDLRDELQGTAAKALNSTAGFPREQKPGFRHREFRGVMRRNWGGGGGDLPDQWQGPTAKALNSTIESPREQGLDFRNRQWQGPAAKALNSTVESPREQKPDFKHRQFQESRESQIPESSRKPRSLIRRTAGIFSHDQTPLPPGKVRNADDKPKLVRRTVDADGRGYRDRGNWSSRQ